MPNRDRKDHDHIYKKVKSVGTLKKVKCTKCNAFKILRESEDENRSGGKS